MLSTDGNYISVMDRLTVCGIKMKTVHVLKRAVGDIHA